ncbi:malonic semialdehyde reductase [Sphingomonas sp. ID1715]|uniref:malonic semialdehyde reductase n=1 Tax=Sphingomonas sp. ID1715 TaxID=1656898 RepID=UPI001488A478|nr:malonic semialdehyde reductase [Sphingomonas sp. ID1715]
MPALPDTALDQLFRTARSYNGYLDRPVGEDQLRAIWDLMKMGPTSANMLPARIVWCVSGEAKAQIASCAMEKNAIKILAAPVTAIIGMDLDFHEQLPELFPHDQTARHWFPDPDGRQVHALRNSSLQGGYFIMAARALGLDTGPMSGFDNAKVDELFFAGTNVKSNFISTLGYGDPSTIFGRLPRPEFERFNQIR